MWTKLGATDYFDTCIIMIMKGSAHGGLLLKPMKLIELTYEFISAALHVSMFALH